MIYQTLPDHSGLLIVGRVYIKLCNGPDNNLEEIIHIEPDVLRRSLVGARRGKGIVNNHVIAGRYIIDLLRGEFNLNWLNYNWFHPAIIVVVCGSWNKAGRILRILEQGIKQDIVFVEEIGLDLYIQRETIGDI